MPLQSSGTLSLDDIHVEAGGATTTTASINDQDIRGLIGKGDSNLMSFNEWYGASAFTSFDWPNVTFTNTPATAFMDSTGYLQTPVNITWGNNGNRIFYQRYSLPWVYWSDVATAWDWSTFTGSVGSWLPTISNYLPSGANTSGIYLADIAFNNNGTKFYYYWGGDGTTNSTSAAYYNYILEFNLNTAWTPSSVASSNYYQLKPLTVTYWPGNAYYGVDGTSLSETSWNNNRASSANNMQWKSDGTRLWVTGYGYQGNSTSIFVIYQYTLSTAWDLSTLSPDHAILINAGTSTTNTNWRHGGFFRMSDNGQRGLMLSQSPTAGSSNLNHTIQDMSFSTAYDISSWTNSRVNVGTGGTWSSTGFNTLGAGSSSQFYQNTSYTGSGFYVHETSTSNYIYTTNSANSSTYSSTKRSDLSTKYNISSTISSASVASDITTLQNIRTEALKTTSYWPTTIYDTAVAHDGSALFIYGFYGGARVWKVNLSTAWDVGSFSPVIGASGTTYNGWAVPTTIGSTSFNINSPGPGFDFCDNGTKAIFTIRNPSFTSSIDFIYATMTTAYDLNTATWYGPMGFTNMSSILYNTSVKVNHDGTVIFVVGHNNTAYGYARSYRHKSSSAYAFNPSSYTTKGANIWGHQGGASTSVSNFRMFVNGLAVDPSGGGGIIHTRSTRYNNTVWIRTDSDFTVGASPSSTNSDFALNVAQYNYAASTDEVYKVIKANLASNGTDCIGATGLAGGTTKIPQDFRNFTF